MFEGAPSTLLTRFAEELRRAGALLLLTSCIPGPDAGRGRDAKGGKEDLLLEIRIGNRADDARRVTGGDRVGGDIFGDDGTGADDDAVAQGDSFENDGARADKAAAADFNRFGVFGIFGEPRESMA